MNTDFYPLAFARCGSKSAKIRDICGQDFEF
jgi:hypothetical protein